MDTATPIGFRDGSDDRQPVCIPLDLRLRHTHVIGQTGTGKSTLMERMALHDIQEGHGVAVLDPCGSMVERLMRLVQPVHADRVIYFAPGDLNGIPLWNPLACTDHQNRSRVVDHVLGAFMGIIRRVRRGDCVEHLLRQALFAVVHLRDGCLLDAANLLRRDSRQSAHIRAQLRHVINDQRTAAFWEEDFDAYTRDDLSTPAYMLSKLLGSEAVGAMLSQGRSAFDFRRIMEGGQVLLVDLSKVGTEAREILGCLVLSLLHLAALGRRIVEGSSLRPFHVYCDEAHRFMTDAMEDFMAETRRSEVSLILSNQHMSQFSACKADVLSSVGSKVMFRVNSNDAQHLRKDLQGKVAVDDLVALDVGYAIARIANEVVLLRTLPPRDIPRDNCRDLIVQQSHERYYRPIR